MSDMEKKRMPTHNFPIYKDLITNKYISWQTQSQLFPQKKTQLQLFYLYFSTYLKIYK